VEDLRLEVADFEGSNGGLAWRWVLTEPGGAFVADHQVRLDAGEPGYEAFTDLYGYLRWRADPQDRVASEAALVAATGRWIGERVFGAVGSALAARAPAVVRVAVPGLARVVAFRPLELAVIAGRPLAAQCVTLVMEVAGVPARVKRPVGQRLRVLGLFSLPEGGGGAALNLRRERFELARLVQDVAQVHGRGVELRVLQYGVTRERLRTVMREGAGWDVVHISGHGGRGAFVLEHRDGRPDPVSSSELVDLLAPAARQIKLVTASACSSAELTAREHLQLLGLAPPVRDAAAGGAAPSSVGPGTAEGAQDGELVPVLAAALAERLDCAVLGMRFPVVDDFAIALNKELYGLLIGQDQPLAAAVGIALLDLVAGPATPACPALSAGTPALFGARAVDLVLEAPPGAPLVFDAERTKLAGFPDQPERFVGRVGVMVRANAALAERSGFSGVLFYGMAGAGKTACALELAYTQEDNFRVLAWYKAPDEDHDITTALTDLAVVLERKLPGLKLAHLLDDIGALQAFLPTLTEFAERSRVLVVIDNIESLLTDAGQWRDARWDLLIGGLTGHAGISRVILTSRRRPAHLDPRVRAESVHALSRDEAVLLARELPHLGALITGTPGNGGGSEQAAVGQGTARELAARVLAAAQGHPKLLELADGQAADPARLGELLGSADQEWQRRGFAPDGLFTSASGEPTAGAADYAAILGTWTRQVADGLSQPARVMFGLLCCLEETDRIAAVIEGNWADLWQRLSLPGDPPAIAVALEPLTSQGLAAAITGTDGDLAGFQVHPGVAAAGRGQAGDAFQAAVDHETAAFWRTVFAQALEQETGWLIVRAGRAAVPYVLRLGERRLALLLLEQVTYRDRSPGTTAALLPLLRQIAADAQGSGDETRAGRLVARALADTDPDASALQLRGLLTANVGSGDYAEASAISLDLINNYMRAGRLTEALALVGEMAEYTRRAGLGRWTQLQDEVLRLQILNLQGHGEEVLTEVTRLRQQMAELPEERDQTDTVRPYNVRELILDTGSAAAYQLQRWAEALALNAELLESKRRRGASAFEIARSRFNDYYALLQLGRLAEARSLLLDCREIDERENNTYELGKDLTALADVEDAAGHGQEAIDLQRDALRYTYLAGEVEAIATSHHNLGNYLARHTTDHPQALAHYLASALLSILTGAEGADSSLRAAAADLPRLPDGAAAPASVSDLCAIADEVPGVHLDRLLAQLTADPSSMQEVLDALLAQARMAAQPSAQITRHLAAWDPVIAGITAAANGNDQARAAVEQHLTERQDSTDWGKLAAVLRAILHGQPGTSLPDDLDHIDIAITRRALAALSGDIQIPGQLWQALPLTELISRVVDAAYGNQDAARQVTDTLSELDTDRGWAPLASALGRILDGDRTPALADGLNPVFAAAVTTILSHLPLPADDRPGDTVNTSPAELASQIAALDDGRAISALHLVLERQGQPVDPIDLRDTQDHLEQALHQPATRQLADPDPAATPGALARTALHHLAATGQASQDLIQQALTRAAPPGQRDPLTFAVGALVLYAFRAEIKLHRDPDQGWTFDLHTKPISDTTLGRLLSQLLGTFGKQ
jgi:tetratricopeptide (TPR) repeat protein